MTADKVFPWYVKQQVIEGWCFLLTDGIVAVFTLTGLVVGLVLLTRKYPNFQPQHHGDESPGRIVGCTMAVLCGIFLFGACVAMCANGGNAISQIKNPEYHAAKVFLNDISNLVPGK